MNCPQIHIEKGICLHYRYNIQKEEEEIQQWQKMAVERGVK